jgi:hypothetical protein
MPAFATPQEEAAYTMLKQVLQNHVTLHRMSLLAAAMAGVGLLGDRCVACCRVGTVPSVVISETLGRLKRQVRTQQTTPSFAPFVVESARDPAAHLGEHSRHLYDALRQLLHESGDAQRFDLQGGMRVVLGLMADVLSMFLHQFDQTLEEVDAIIDEVVGPALESYLKTPFPLLPSEHHG